MSTNDEVQYVIMDVSTLACTQLVIHVDKTSHTCTLVAHMGAIIGPLKKKVTKKKIVVSNNMLDQCMEKMVSVLACAYK